MQEIEVKILDIKRVELENKLKNLGAKKVFDGEIKAENFDFEDERITRSKDLLRLRKEGEKAVLTFKKFTGETKDVKSLKEIEVEVSDLNIMKEILEELKLIPMNNTRKLRTSYALEGVKFEFDKYLDENDFIPEFLEIEAHDIIILYKYVTLLGFKKEDCKSWNYFDVKKHYLSTWKAP